MVESVTRIVVIGAGQAGLSVAYYLKRFDLVPEVDFILIDRGPETGGAWQFRWEELRLGTAHRISDLPGMDALGVSFDTADRTVPARDVVADYYRRYEDYYDLQVRRPVRATGVANRDADLAVTTSEGDIRTHFVVNATGTWGAPFIPYYPGMRSFAGRQVHTADYSSAQDFAGQHVIVVGAGTSAVGFLMELEGVAASTQWATRSPADFRDEIDLSPESSAAAVAMQDDAARAGRALPSIVSGTGVPRTRRIAAAMARGILADRRMFSRIEERGVRWPDGSFSPADTIIWATGFRPEARQLAPLKLREKAGGLTVAGGASWTDPRIFFAGYGPQASTVGAGRAGRMIARQIVAALG